jgi:Uncharacterized protein conserved in bacteria (DUF2252)
MKRSPRMTIQQATKDYEAWLAGQLEIVPADLALKHERMRAAVFPFLRATYYRWAQLYPEHCHDLCSAPQVLAVGDLHVENFGTWRDAEGRLVWGINDFDETCTLPYTHDLVRLATSAHLAVADGHLEVTGREACESLLAGYREGLEAGGRPFVLAEHSHALRDMALARLREPAQYWEKLQGLATYREVVPLRVVKALSALLPRPDLPRRVVHRVAGLGSLGRQRFVALAEWQGGKIAREAKALAQSAAIWAHGGQGSTKVLYQTILDQSVRCIDPWVRVKRRWIVRRLAPDCSRIELADLPQQREETRLLRAMGWETANVHLGSRTAHALLVDLAARETGWLHQAASVMLAAVQTDWEAWSKDPVPHDKSEAAVRPHRVAAGAAAAADGDTDDELPADQAPPSARSADKSDKAKSEKAKSDKIKSDKAKSDKAKGEKAKRDKARRDKAKSDKAKGDKGDKGDGSAQDVKPGKVAKAGKSGKGGKADKTAKVEDKKPPKASKTAKVSKAPKAAKASKVAKVAKPSDPAKAGKASNTAKASKAAKPSKAAAAKPSKAAKSPKDKPGKAAKAGKAEKPGKAAKVAKPGKAAKVAAHGGGAAPLVAAGKPATGTKAKPGKSRQSAKSKGPAGAAKESQPVTPASKAPAAEPAGQVAVNDQPGDDPQAS